MDVKDKRIRERSRAGTPNNSDATGWLSGCYGWLRNRQLDAARGRARQALHVTQAAKSELNSLSRAACAVQQAVQHAVQTLGAASCAVLARTDSGHCCEPHTFVANAKRPVRLKFMSTILDDFDFRV